MSGYSGDDAAELSFLKFLSLHCSGDFGIGDSMGSHGEGGEDDGQ
jgi:hypothetical protein